MAITDFIQFNFGLSFFVFASIYLILSLIMIVIFYKDIKRREMSVIFWFLVIIFFNFFGLIFYILVRNPISKGRGRGKRQ